MTKYEKQIWSRIDKAVWEYKLIGEDDNVLVAVSGGADSMALLALLKGRTFVYSKKIQVKGVYIDLGFGKSADRRCQIMQDYFDQLGVEGRIVRTEIGPYAHSEANRENPCFLCSRIRRKKIFEVAEELGCNRIAFGHHKNDIVETLLMNMIFSREISTMPPDLPVFDGKYHIIRPMVFVDEYMLKKYANEKNIPTFKSGCPTDGNSKRQYVKNLLGQIESDIHGSRENIFASMKRVKTDYLL